MKKLTPTPNPNAEVWVPEDGVDRRTAASLEGAFQALLDRIQGTELFPPHVRPFRDSSTNVANIVAPKQKGVTDNGSYMWLSFGTTSTTLQRIDLLSMAKTDLPAPSGVTATYYIRVNPSTGTLFAVMDTTTINIYRSTDLGQTWVEVLTGISARPYFAFNGATVLAAGSGGGNFYSWISTDDGVTWTASSAPGGWSRLEDLQYWNGRWWAKDGYSPYVFTSIDGTAWTAFNVGATGAVPGRLIATADYLYLPVRPLVRVDTALNYVAISGDAISALGQIGGHIVYWSSGSNPVLVDVATGDGVFCPKPYVFSDNYAVWDSGVAKW